MNFEKLNETNCRIGDIQNNDKIPIGGSFYGRLDLAVTADIDSFETFFVTVEKNALSFENNDAMKKWIARIVPDFDVKAFAHMYAFDNVLRKMYPNLSSDLSARQQFYDKEGNKTLSQSVKAGVCKCAEIAVLAQAYLQRQGFRTKYFGGELLRSFDDGIGQAHSFISFQTEHNDYFYDPANPMFNRGVYLPRISVVEATLAQKKQFENKIHSNGNGRNCAFLEAKNILTKAGWYYGCGDKADIFPSFIISKHNIQPLRTKEKNLSY